MEEVKTESRNVRLLKMKMATIITLIIKIKIRTRRKGDWQTIPPTQNKLKKNQSGKDFSFFVPGNIVSNIEVELTTFQGTPITNFALNAFSEGGPFSLRNNGMGVFVTLRFDVLE